jgi:FAD binding domain/Berberine and berberine like
MRWAGKKFKEKLIKVRGWQEPPSIGDPFTSDDVGALEQAIAGSVILPSAASYNQDRLLSNFAFQSYPALIVYCEVFADVGYCLAFAKAHGLPIAVRSGGHSTAGLSINDGLVIDLSRLHYAVVDPAAKQAKVGAGTNFHHLDASLDAFGLHVPAGGCADVCVAGFMQGGGYGYTSRNFGLNCDNVECITVMLADGQIVMASDAVNGDLFWALRGGLGGNLAVVLEITYKLHDLGELWGFRVQWPLEPGAQDVDNAARAFAVMQAQYMRGGVAGEFGYKAFLAWQKGIPCLVMRGMFNGTPADGRKILAPLLQIPGADLTIDVVGSYRQLEKLVVHDSPALPDVPDLAREEKESGMIAQPLSEDDWRRIITKFLETPNQSSLFGTEPYGGAVSRVGPGETAFIHRDAYMNFYLDVFWMSEDKRGEVVEYLDRFMDFMKPYTNGESCQTYPRLGQADYRHRYWGDWFETLLAVKQKYDPGNVFSHALALTSEPGRPTRPMRHGLPQLAEPIQYGSWSMAIRRR